MWDILCCCPEKEAEKEPSTAPCTPDLHPYTQRGVLNLGTLLLYPQAPSKRTHWAGFSPSPNTPAP